jgi:hypothetical protein
VVTKLRDHWISLGKPIAILACPTCKQMFQRYLPEVECIFLYQLFQEWGISASKSGEGELISVFDPCSSRNEPGLQQAVRQIVQEAGFTLEPLPLEGRLAACCSWGGQVSTANPRFAREVISARIAQNENPYITYCVNCRDIFSSNQKPVYHVLDILFGLHDSKRMPPTLTERRNNRILLKQKSLSEFWKEKIPMETGESHMKLVISPQVRQKLSDEKILEKDVEAVIEHCESRGRKVLHPESGHFMGHLQIGNMTYWAEYAPAEDGFELFNAYSHRMSIDEG